MSMLELAYLSFSVIFHVYSSTLVCFMSIDFNTLVLSFALF